MSVEDLNLERGNEYGKDGGEGIYKVYFTLALISTNKIFKNTQNAPNCYFIFLRGI